MPFEVSKACIGRPSVCVCVRFSEKQQQLRVLKSEGVIECIMKMKMKMKQK